MHSHQFKNAQGLLQLCKTHHKPISEIAILYEKEHTANSRAEILKKMKKVKETMEEAVQNGIHHRQKSFMDLAAADAPKIFHAYLKTEKSEGLGLVGPKPKRMKEGGRIPTPHQRGSGELMGETAGVPQKKKYMFMSPIVLRAMAYATATNETNACMGRIVAFPTAGGAGVVPGVIFGYAHEHQLSEEKILRGLFTASAIGLIIAENATLSAAAGGCQAEVGAAIAMGTAAITEMRGGTPEQCLNASALGLKSYLGVVCDPLGGLVAVPCIKRNTLGAATAMAASDLSISGVKSYLPFDEVVLAMHRIGKTMSTTLKETALGGLAVTPTGLRVRKKLGLPPLKPLDTPDDQPKTLQPTEKMIHWVE